VLAQVREPEVAPWLRAGQGSRRVDASSKRAPATCSARANSCARFFSVSHMYLLDTAARSTRYSGRPSRVASQATASVLPVPEAPTNRARTPGR
jgi:hypothetical protein